MRDPLPKSDGRTSLPEVGFESTWRLPPWCYYVVVAAIIALYTLTRTTWARSVYIIPTVGHRFIAAYWAACVVLFTKVATEGHTRREWAGILVACGIAVLIRATTGDLKLVLTIFVVVASRDVDIRLLCKVLLAVVTAVFCVSASASLAGIVPMAYGSRETMLGITRMSLGFANPNGVGLVCLEACVYAAVICWRRHPVAHGVFSAVALFFALFVAGSRAAAVCIVLVFALVQASRSARVTTWRSGGYALAALLVVLVVASIGLVVTFDSSSEFFSLLDTIFSKRLSFTRFFLDLYPPSLFGLELGRLPMVTLPGGIETRFLVDNAYMRLLLGYGVFGFVAWVGSMLALFWKAARERTTNVCLLMLGVWLVYGLMEQAMLGIEPDVILVMLSVLVYDKPVSDFSVSGDLEKSGIAREARKL